MISIITDAFFDDIVGFLYLMACHKEMNVFPTGIGYTRPHTTVDVCQGLHQWYHSLCVSRLDRKPYDPDTYWPFTDQTTLDFGAALAKYLHLHGHNSKERLEYNRDILILGPYSNLAKHLHKRDLGQFHVYGSFSNLRFAPTDPFPSPITLGTSSNAGIDPMASLKVWSHCPTILLCRQPPIDQVLLALEGIDTRISRRIKKVLRYSKEHNPGGGYVWDLGLALVYQNPDLITRTQLYDATFNPTTKQITLATTVVTQQGSPQVTLVDVDLAAMLVRLRETLK